MEVPNDSTEPFFECLVRWRNHRSQTGSPMLVLLCMPKNCTKNEATGYASHFHMFGWHLRLSIDAFLGVCPDEAGYSSPSEYIGKLKDRMRRAYKLASETAKKTTTDNKRRYD